MTLRRLFVVIGEDSWKCASQIMRMYESVDPVSVDRGFIVGTDCFRDVTDMVYDKDRKIIVYDTCGAVIKPSGLASFKTVIVQKTVTFRYPGCPPAMLYLKRADNGDQSATRSPSSLKPLFLKLRRELEESTTIEKEYERGLWGSPSLPQGK